MIEAALEVLPDEPQNLNRPHVDVNSPHLTAWPNQSLLNLGAKIRFQYLKVICSRRNVAQPKCAERLEGNFSSTRLGMRWYRSAITFSNDTSTFQLGAAGVDVDSR